MPLASEAADHEIVNGNVTEAESAGLSGRGADGMACAGAIPTTRAKPQRTTKAGRRAFNAAPPLGLTVVYASLDAGRNRGVLGRLGMPTQDGRRRRAELDERHPKAHYGRSCESVFVGARWQEPRSGLAFGGSP